jgi:predicted TIM-barrel fold metal-dependent hydrolase
VQTSAFFRVSGDEFPYPDTRGPLRELISTFGPQRLLWGSDFPWVSEQCGYKNAWNVLEDEFLSEEEREWIMGKTFLSLFPGLATV